MSRPVVALRIIGALLVVIVGLAEFVGTSAVAGRRATAPPQPEPVVSARLVCPNMATWTDGSTDIRTWLGVAVPSTLPPPGTPAAGEVTTARVTPVKRGGHARPTTVLTRRGEADFMLSDKNKGAVTVDGTGRLAPGLGAEQLTRRDDGAYRGLDGVACTPPSGDAWAVGAATTVGVHSLLTLTNVDDTTALADVILNGPHGELVAPRGRGITVAPHTSLEVPLEDLAPARRLLLVHVDVRGGRLAVALRRQDQQAATPKGVDYLPLVDAPTRRQVVPGIFGGEGPRRLVIANPSDLAATATVQLVTPDAAFVPEGLAHFTVGAGDVLDVDITKRLDGGPAAAVVTADQPIVVGAEISSGPHVGGIAETAWSAAVPPLDGTAVVTTNDVVFRQSYIFLSAPRDPATVTIRTLRGVGAEGRRSTTVRVPAGHTVVVNLLKLSGGRPDVAVELTPEKGAGDVYAAREVYEVGSRAPLYTVMPVRSSPFDVLVPPAVYDIRVGVG